MKQCESCKKLKVHISGLEFSISQMKTENVSKMDRLMAELIEAKSLRLPQEEAAARLHAVETNAREYRERTQADIAVLKLELGDTKKLFSEAIHSIHALVLVVSKQIEIERNPREGTY